MAGRLIDLDHLSNRDREAWEQLASRALEPNPFFEPDFVLAAHRHLDGRGTGLLVAEADGEWTACLPVATGRWRGPVKAVRSWRHKYAFLGTPLVAGADPARALRELLQAAASARSGGLLALEWVAGDGPVASALSQALDDSALVRAVDLSFSRATLHRNGGSPLERLPKRRRHELQRQRRRLDELLGSPLRLVDRAGDDEAVERFLELEARGWKGTGGTAFLARPGHAAFFREICQAFAAMGRLQLLELHGGGRTVAMKCNLVAPPGLFTFKIAHDPELGRFSPGVQMELENVEKFHETDLEWMDSCASPDNQMIRRLWPEHRPITTVVVARGGLRARAASGWFRAMRTVRERRSRSTAT